jgi:cytochrome o ubiquinol oxidase subunit 2
MIAVSKRLDGWRQRYRFRQFVRDANDGLTRRFRTLQAVAVLALMTGGCGIRYSPTLNPKGPIAEVERELLMNAFMIMLIVVIPVFVLTFWFAWRYREGNKKATYAPDWSYSWKIDSVTWIVPTLIVVSLGLHVWVYTHLLDPYRKLNVDAKPLEVSVVAQDWKWLFLYPEHNIASVNQLVFPKGVPLNLKITSDTVLNSFFIPALGGQIYAMAGMRTELKLLADEPGQFMGKNTQYSGRGFSDQHFQAIATTPEEFEDWVAKVRRSPNKLDGTSYAKLAEPTVAHPVTYYSGFDADLFDQIILKYGSCTDCPGTGISQ